MNWRVKLGITFVIFFSLFQSFRALEYYDPFLVWKNARSTKGISVDFLTKYRKDISCLVPDLSPNQAVGFVTSIPDRESTWRAKIYHMTQFSIAPFLLDDSLDHDLAIAYYPVTIKPRPDTPPGFFKAKKCTNEIFLLRRDTR